MSRRTSAGLVLTLLLAWPCGAQPAGSAGSPLPLSLEEALVLALRHSPTYLSALNDEGPAAWRVREAYASFLPRADVSGGMRYEAGGEALFGSLTAADIGFTETPPYYFSSYSATASWSLSPQTWYGLSEKKAGRRAVAARIGAEELILAADVKRAYVAALRARDEAELRRQQLGRAEENLELAGARSDAGVGIPLDAKQARVERGRAEVAVLTAEASYRTARLRLLQAIGLGPLGEVRLTTDLVVFEPAWPLESLEGSAVEGHPALRALEATAGAQRAAARTAWSSYLPTLSAQLSLSGFTRQVGSNAFLLAQEVGDFERQLSSCEDWNDLNSRLANPFPGRDCSGYRLTDTRMDSLESAVVSSNQGFPLGFQQQPLTLSVGLSLPVFTGFTRHRQVAEAEAAAEDTEHRLRAERLRIQADVAAAHFELETAWRAVQLEASNRELAAEQLVQARERYRVGLDSFVQLTEAETLKSEADQAYLAAVYTFHEALADLEAAAGRPLDTEGR